MCIEIPTTQAIASVIACLQGQSALASSVAAESAIYTGAHCWAREYADSTVGYKLTQILRQRYDRSDAAENDTRFEETLEVVLKGLQCAFLSHNGKFYHFKVCGWSYARFSSRCRLSGMPATPNMPAR